MKNVLLFILIIISNFTFSQITLDEFNRNYLINKKPTIIYFYTDWCSYCKIQEKEIEKNNRLNRDFYFLKINAETEKEIIFLDEKYSPVLFNNKVKTHNFVKIFTQNNEESYPLWIFLDDKLNIINQHSGVLFKSQIEEVLQNMKQGSKD